MHKHLALVLAALALTLCTTAMLHEGLDASSTFSFEQCSTPSLLDVNQSMYRVLVENDVYRLTNVHKSFEKSFDLFQDEHRRVSIIQDKRGRTMFEGNLEVVVYTACVDLDRDGDLDVLVLLASFGNHGNGVESYEVLLNDHGRFIHQSNSIAIEHSGGLPNKAGILTWYSAPQFCAVFVGEEADVTGDGSEDDPIIASNIRQIREVWGHANGSMRLISKSSIPIDQQSAKYREFR